MPKTIDVPVSLLTKMSKAAKAFEELDDELEDFLLSRDPQFIEKMRRARESHASGQTRPLADLARELCTK